MDTKRHPYSNPGSSTGRAPGSDESRSGQRVASFTLEPPPNGTEIRLGHGGTGQVAEGHLEVLVVEDEPLVAMTIVLFLQLLGHRSTTCFTGETALSAIREKEYDPALVDLGMPEMDGWEICRRINEITPDLPVVLVSGRNVSAQEIRKLQERVSGVLGKPFGSRQLTDVISQATASDRRR